MKNYRYIILLVALLGYACGTFAQATATASVSATIVRPIGIVKKQDMSFGKLAIVSGQGSVVLSPATKNRSASGGIELVDGGNVSFASFDVSGSVSETFAITLPSTPVILSNGENSMTVSDFTSTPTSSASLAEGIKNIVVGATLHVNGDQALGMYASLTPFPVTVNYN